MQFEYLPDSIQYADIMRRYAAFEAVRYRIPKHRQWRCKGTAAGNNKQELNKQEMCMSPTSAINRYRFDPDVICCEEFIVWEAVA